MHADWFRIVVISLLTGCSVLATEQPYGAIVADADCRQPIPQVILKSEGQGPAVIFIGGFGDEISGIMPQVMELLPPLEGLPESRAYYHWHAGYPQNVALGAKALAEHIREYRRKNIAADVVLIGHSMGASTVLRTAHLLSPTEGRVFLVTLDPADRSYRPRRPKSATWWGNSFVSHSLSGHDYIAELGGRWNVCRGADVNLHFDGRKRDEAGLNYIHDNALSLLASRNHGLHLSLLDSLRQQIISKESKNSPADAEPTSKQQQEQANTTR